MDTKIFYRFYNLADKHPIIGSCAIFCARYVSFIFGAIYASGLVLSAFRASNLFMRYLLVPFFTLLYNTLMRRLINRPRPFAVLAISPRLEHESNGSCPSNHAASAMIIALGWFMLNPFLAIFFTILAVWTGISRIMAGVHYPSDILVAWGIALVLGCLGFFIL